MSVELHLPDLPEVPLSLGAPDGQRGRGLLPWHQRLRDLLWSYLPLLLMALLALATWWLVKQSPRPQAEAPAAAAASEPDVVMTQFTLERFDTQGRLKLRVSGAEIRHYPDSDRVDIERASIVAYAPDGRVTQAAAARVHGQADGSELFLDGGAEVVGVDSMGLPLSIRGESLQAYVLLDRVLAPKPVQVQHAGAQLRAQGLVYDHAKGKLELSGPVRGSLQARVPPPTLTPGPWRTPGT
jgi:lipopolysaccharide export system protein LptC